MYPNLKYVTAGDARVRDAHKILDGLILPINHPFWKSHTAPLDWGCRCHIEQTDNDPSKVIPSYKVKPEFQNNAFHSGKVFAEPAYAKELTSVETKKSNKLAKKLFHEQNPVTLERYKSIPFEKEKGMKNGGDRKSVV